MKSPIPCNSNGYLVRIHTDATLRLLLSRSLFWACREAYLSKCRQESRSTDLSCYLENETAFGGNVVNWAYAKMAAHFRFAYDVREDVRQVNPLMPRLEVHRRWFVYWYRLEIENLRNSPPFPELLLLYERAKGTNPNICIGDLGDLGNYMDRRYPHIGDCAIFTNKRMSMWDQFTKIVRAHACQVM